LDEGRQGHSVDAEDPLEEDEHARATALVAELGAASRLAKDSVGDIRSTDTSKTYLLSQTLLLLFLL
jgi:hypothetical protein